MIEQKAYTVKELRKILNIPQVTAYELVRAEGFPSFRIGGRWRISRVGLEKWIEDRSKGTK